MDWNAADMSETTSANPQAVANVAPGTPGLVNQKMRGAFAAIAAASEAAEVKSFLLAFTCARFIIYPSSLVPKGCVG
jgi:hypothetical protein